VRRRGRSASSSGEEYASSIQTLSTSASQRYREINAVADSPPPRIRVSTVARRFINWTVIVANLAVFGALRAFGLWHWTREKQWTSICIVVTCVVLLTTNLRTRRPCVWYTFWLGLAFVSSPPMRLSNADVYFGRGSACPYTLSLSYFNANLIFWNMVYSWRLIALKQWQRARHAAMIGALIQCGLLKAQSESEFLTSEVDAFNGTFMLLFLMVVLIYDILQDDPDDDATRRHATSTTGTHKHNTVTIAIHILYVVLMFLDRKPLRTLFDIDPNVDREKRGLYLPPNLAAFQWLRGYMIIELVYLAEQQGRPWDTWDIVINVLVDVSKLILSLHSAHFLWFTEKSGGEDPSKFQYLSHAAVHIALKLVTITINWTHVHYNGSRTQKVALLFFVVVLFAFLGYGIEYSL